MRRTLLLTFVTVIIFLLAYAGATTLSAQTGNQIYLPLMTYDECWPTDIPAGALPGMPPPVFCLINNYGPDTAQPGPNSWLDTFDHGLSLANFSGTRYRLFNNIGAWRTIQWRHADHWMVDLAPRPREGGGYQYGRGYAMLSPDQTFNFVNNRLVVETTVAAGMEVYDEKAWPEIIVSTDPAPVHTPLGLYAFDLLPQGWTLGCRLQSSRVPICALKANDGSPTEQSTRIWEMSFWQVVGTNSYGGFPGNGLENYWRSCAVDVMDIHCRDKFRLELTRTSLRLYANDVLYFEQTGLPPLPDGLLNGDVYVYLASAQIDHPADSVRYHWDLLKVNP